MTSARLKVFSEASRPPGPSSSAARPSRTSPSWRLVGKARSLDLRRQLQGWVACAGQLLPPARHEVLDALVAFAVPRGARRHRAGAVRGVRADGRFDLGRAVGVYFPGFFRYARDGPTAQAPRAPRVWLDPVAELDGLGGSSHAADSGGGVEVVAEEPCVERFPPASFVAHTDQICDQDVVVDLGVTGSCRRMAGHRPGEAFCWCAQLSRPRLPPWSCTTCRGNPLWRHVSASRIMCMSSARPITPSSAIDL